MATKYADIAALVRNLYSIVRQLEERSPGRSFTLDGHLVGSIGEVLAAHDYGLVLLPASAEKHDARAPDGRLVQVKATQVKRVGLYSQPQHLLVLRLDRDGTVQEVYNGPGDLAWGAASQPQKNGQRQISLARLTQLMCEVPKAQRLARVAVASVARARTDVRVPRAQRVAP